MKITETISSLLISIISITVQMFIPAYFIRLSAISLFNINISIIGLIYLMLAIKTMEIFVFGALDKKE